MVFSISFSVYSLDNATVCNQIFISSDFNRFLALREFFKQNPSYLEQFNPGDEGYCFNLRTSFGFFPHQLYNNDETKQFYDNCLNMTEQELNAEYESYFVIKRVIQLCRLY